jgi:hypothetical protein
MEYDNNHFIIVSRAYSLQLAWTQDVLKHLINLLPRLC